MLVLPAREGQSVGLPTKIEKWLGPSSELTTLRILGASYVPSIHTSLSGMPFHSFLLKFHGKNAAMGRCDGPRTYMGARWKATSMVSMCV